jgi:hypothetical protein
MRDRQKGNKESMRDRQKGSKEPMIAVGWSRCCIFRFWLYFCKRVTGLNPCKMAGERRSNDKSIMGFIGLLPLLDSMESIKTSISSCTKKGLEVPQIPS